MSRSSRHVMTLSLARGGLALPTALAAAVCGGSLLAIATTGAVALDGGQHLAVDVASAGSPLDAPIRSSAATRSHPNASGLPPAGAFRESGRQRPALRVRREPSQAATASQFTIEVHRPPQEDRDAGAASGSRGAGRARLLSPQVVDPAAPTIIVAPDPAAAVPPSTPTVDPSLPSDDTPTPPAASGTPSETPPERPQLDEPPPPPPEVQTTDDPGRETDPDDAAASVTD